MDIDFSYIQKNKRNLIGKEVVDTSPLNLGECSIRDIIVYKNLAIIGLKSEKGDFEFEAPYTTYLKLKN